MNIEKKNAVLILLYLYNGLFLSLLEPILPDKQVSNLGYLLMFILITYSLIINKLYFSKKFLLILSILFILMFLNLLLVSYKYFVAVEVFTTVINFIVPLYIFSLGKFDYKYFMDTWFRLAKKMIFLSPVCIYLYLNTLIGYSTIGIYAHYNLIIIAYYFVIVKQDRVKLFLYMLVYLSIGFIMGARMVFVASVLVIITLVLFIDKKRNFQYYLRIFFLIALSITTLLNIKKILIDLQDFLFSRGITSRNLHMFIRQLEGNDEYTSSGRDYIYSIAIDYISERSGLPGGMGVIRKITNDQYYYSHNVVIDFILVFGLIGFIIFVLWYSFRVIKLYRRSFNYYQLSLFFILATSFWVQSATGSYFLSSQSFWVSTAILVFFKGKLALHINPYLLCNDLNSKYK